MYIHRTRGPMRKIKTKKMSCTLIPAVLLCLFIAVPVNSQPNTPKKDKLIFVGNADYAPYSYSSDNGPAGYAIDIIKTLQKVIPSLGSKKT